jgi:hypothetical protein
MARVDGLIRLEPQLALDRCPQCGVDRPSLIGVWATMTTAHNLTNKRHWQVYACSRCASRRRDARRR